MPVSPIRFESPGKSVANTGNWTRFQLIFRVVSATFDVPSFARSASQRWTVNSAYITHVGYPTSPSAVIDGITGLFKNWQIQPLQGAISRAWNL
jgi:hypothetical protein